MSECRKLAGIRPNFSLCSSNTSAPWRASVDEKILEYTYGFKDDRTNNPKKDGSWDLIDVLSIYFINYEAESEVDLSRKLIKAARYKAITVLVGTVKKVDTHYTIGLKMGDPIDNIWDDDDIIE